MFRRILVPMDGSRSSASVVGYAAELAVRLEWEVDLLFVEAKPGGRLPHPLHHRGAQSGASTGDEVRAAYEEYLERHGEEFEVLGITVKKHVRCGDPVDEILNAALDLRSDIIAMATRHRGQFAKPRAGSVAAEVLWRSRLPVLLVAEG